jgi:hypothetical protein
MNQPEIRLADLEKHSFVVPMLYQGSFNTFNNNCLKSKDVGDDGLEPPTPCL